MINDPLSDMLTRIRNALQVRQATVQVVNTKINAAVADILKREGFIAQVVPCEPYKLTIRLKYQGRFSPPSIVHLQRLSRPSLRRYCKAKHIPRMLNGMGLVILTTSQGILTDREARQKNIGGELLCSIW